MQHLDHHEEGRISTASTEGVAELIEREYESLSPELQRAARWLKQHQAALALYSMRTSAKGAGVSPATMTRLAQRLGFEGFDELRALYAAHLAAGMPAAPVARPGRSVNDPLDDPVTVLNEHQRANVTTALALNSSANLCAAADLLLHARNVYFLGMRVCHGVAFHASYIHGLLASNGVLINDHGGTLADQITRLARDDVLVAISQSPYARQTVDSVQQAIERHATVIALTDSALSPIARRAQLVLLFESSTSSFFPSTVGAEALIEMLMSTLAARGGAATQRRLRQMHERLHNTRAYWERPALSRQDRSTTDTRSMETLP
jgi:DNA-binding MurR/RpiR family transcriptional regulator